MGEKSQVCLAVTRLFKMQNARRAFGRLTGNDRVLLSLHRCKTSRRVHTDLQRPKDCSQQIEW